jgi:hypothetical protein
MYVYEEEVISPYGVCVIMKRQCKTCAKQHVMCSYSNNWRNNVIYSASDVAACDGSGMANDDDAQRIMAYNINDVSSYAAVTLKNICR